jgi:hypothetical protein
LVLFVHAARHAELVGRRGRQRGRPNTPATQPLLLPCRRLVIIRTLPYTPVEMVQILAVRAQVGARRALSRALAPHCCCFALPAQALQQRAGWPGVLLAVSGRRGTAGPALLAANGARPANIVRRPLRAVEP